MEHYTTIHPIYIWAFKHIVPFVSVTLHLHLIAVNVVLRLECRTYGDSCTQYSMSSTRTPKAKEQLRLLVTGTNACLLDISIYSLTVLSTSFRTAPKYFTLIVIANTACCQIVDITSCENQLCKLIQEAANYLSSSHSPRPYTFHYFHSAV